MPGTMAFMKSGHRFYQLALVAAAVSGAAALTHELMWTRRLIDLMGATHEASARVVACFFLGLSLGSAFIAWRSDRVVRPWKAAALVELLVAAACLPVLFLPQLYVELWQQLGPTQLVSSRGELVKLGISAAVVLPPAFCMGMTIPLMVAGVARRDDRSPASGIWLYASNTGGGVLGMLVATQWWLWWLAVRGTIVVSIMLNLVAAAACLLLDRRTLIVTAQPKSELTSSRRREPTETTNADSREESTVAGARPWWGLTLAFVSGLGVLAMEVLCINLFSHVISTMNATAAVLAAFILVLFLSAMAFPKISPRYLSARQLVAPVMRLGAITICLVPVWFMIVTDNLQRTYDGFGYSLLFVTTVTISVMAAAGPAVFLAGLVFPLAIVHFADENRRTLRDWGTAIAVNGLGGALGATVAGHVLMGRFGLYQSFGVVGLMYATIPLVAAICDRSCRSWTMVCWSIATVVLVWGLSVTALSALPVVYQQESARVLAVEPGPDGVIAVIERDYEMPRGPRDLSFDGLG